MKKIFPALITGLLLSIVLTSCGLSTAGGNTTQPALTDNNSTQPYIETSEDIQSATERDTSDRSAKEDTQTAQQEQSTIQDDATGVQSVTDDPQVQSQTKDPLVTVTDKKPLETNAPITTEKPTQKPTVKPVTTQTPATKATEAPTQATTEAPTLVPEGNYISFSISGYEKAEVLEPTVMEFTDGDSAFDLIKKITRENKIPMEFKGSGITAYIEGIDNVYEFDYGSQSGWMYKVNDEYPEVSCGRYKVKPGDIVEFVYSINMGKDRREG